MQDGGLVEQSRRARAADRRRQRGEVAAMAALLAGLAAIPGYIFAETAIGAMQEKAAWKVAGPPCPVVAKPSPRGRGHRIPKEHAYGPVRFIRSFGAVSCAAFRDPALLSNPPPYRVCQFNNPGAVTVQTARERVTFEAAPGRTLTVTVRDGHATCVVGGWFRL